MDPSFAERLRGLTSRIEIERAVRELCGPYGGIKRCQLVPDGAGGQFCFIDLALPEHRMKLFYALDAVFYGGSLGFRIPVAAEERAKSAASKAQ